MAAEAIIETHVDAELKQQAEQVFTASGFTMDQMIRRLLQKTVEDQCVHVDFFSPNAETLEAMNEARSGTLSSYGTVEELFADLNAKD